MDKIKPKKYLGQNFLKDENIAKNIVESLSTQGSCKNVLEVGAGKGVLTKYLIKNPDINFKINEIDNDMINYLTEKMLVPRNIIIHQDFLTLNLKEVFEDQMAIIGNFPYNISSQILFSVLNFKDYVTEIVGMFQKEVAQRIASPEGNKDYGILSVLMQTYYDIKYLFTIDEGSFFPAPKIKSGVVRFVRKEDYKIDCNEKLFFQIIKSGFNQRRKKLSNALGMYKFENTPEIELLLHKRAEQLNYKQFIVLTKHVL